ncbi:MAG: hypothetical protein ACJA0P_002699 [Planctomycetota bacterium]|jgi:hypothetical protein
MSAYRVHGCRDYRARLDGILDGVAPLKSHQEVEAHAEDCRVCADELRRALEVRRWIDSTPEPELASQAEDVFIRGVLDRIESLEPAAGASRVMRPAATAIRWGSRAAVAMAAAAVALWFFPSGDLPQNAVDQEVARAVEPSVVGPTETVAQEATPAYATLPEPAAIDRLAFASALAELQAASYRPGADFNSRDWFDPITLEFGSEGAVRGARAILRDPKAADLAPLAARLLGTRADLRDRRLLTETLSVTGMAGTLALAERGSNGVEILWRLASAESEESAEAAVGALAARALMRCSQAGRLVLGPSLDLSANTPLAAELIAASGAGGAARLLDLYLSGGEPEWLEAWTTTPDRDDSLEARLRNRSRRRDSSESGRMLAAVERARFSGGLAFVLTALEDGDMRAPSVLAALPGTEPFMALLGAAGEGRLRPIAEDAAWGEIAGHRSEDLLAWILDPLDIRGQRADAVIPRLAMIVEERPAARRLLALMSLEQAPSVHNRTRALLYAVDGLGDEPGDEEGDEVLFDGPIQGALVELTGADDARLAAAAWIACRRMGQPTLAASSEISRALDRAGTGAVHHLRIVRAIERARASASRRGPSRSQARSNARSN